MSQTRRSKGTPVGGQYAATVHAEASGDLPDGVFDDEDFAEADAAISDAAAEHVAVAHADVVEAQRRYAKMLRRQAITEAALLHPDGRFVELAGHGSSNPLVPVRLLDDDHEVVWADSRTPVTAEDDLGGDATPESRRVSRLGTAISELTQLDVMGQSEAVGRDGRSLIDLEELSVASDLRSVA